MARGKYQRSLYAGSASAKAPSASGRRAVKVSQNYYYLLQSSTDWIKRLICDYCYVSKLLCVIGADMGPVQNRPQAEEATILRPLLLLAFKQCLQKWPIQGRPNRPLTVDQT